MTYAKHNDGGPVRSFIGRAALLEALREIAKGDGPFNRDPLIHAENCINRMVDLARVALKQAEESQA